MNLDGSSHPPNISVWRGAGDGAGEGMPPVPGNAPGTNELSKWEASEGKPSLSKGLYELSTPGCGSLTGRNSSKFFPKAGISGTPSRSKSMLSPKEFFPRASFMHAYRIWNMTLSSSNLISVLVGWILTSTDCGSMSRYMRYVGVTPSGIRFS